MKKLLLSFCLFASMPLFACPDFYFHLTFSGTRTFIIQNINNPADNITVTGTNSIDAWNFNTSLGNHCGMTFGSDVCYTIIEATEHITSDEIISVRFNGSSPNHLTINYDGVTKTFSITNPGNTSAYSLSWGDNADNPPTCCSSDIIITGSYTTILTESGTWIKSSGITFVPGNVPVTLDANPVNGFIELYPGFEVQMGATFVAQALDGCGPAIPI